MEKRFRQDYTGEFVITEIKQSSGNTTQQREWIPNPIQNYHTSGRAAVIGSRIDEKRFRHQRLQRHRGGLLGKNKLQTYGTRDIWVDMALDFYVSTDVKDIRSIAKSGYDERCTVYTTPRHCLDNPGRFYIVPYLPPLDISALAIYLAAFDGHREVFMLGYARDMPSNSSNWAQDVTTIFQTYDTTKFILVGRSSMPDNWMTLANVSQIEFRKFITYCDV